VKTTEALGFGIRELRIAADHGILRQCMPKGDGPIASLSQN
jgi:hypothetical protein